MTYTKEEIQKAAELTEVSRKHAEDIVEMLDRAREALKKEEKFNPIQIRLDSSIKTITFVEGGFYVE